MGLHIRNHLFKKKKKKTLAFFGGRGGGDMERENENSKYVLKLLIPVKHQSLSSDFYRSTCCQVGNVQ